MEALHRINEWINELTDRHIPLDARLMEGLVGAMVAVALFFIVDYMRRNK